MTPLDQRPSPTAQAQVEDDRDAGCSKVRGKTLSDILLSPPIRAQGESNHYAGCSKISVKTPLDLRPSPTNQPQDEGHYINGYDVSSSCPGATGSKPSKRLVVATPWLLDRDVVIRVAGRPIRPEPNPPPAPVIRPIDFRKPPSVPIAITKRNK